MIIPSRPVTKKKGIYFGAEERELGPSSVRDGRIYRLAVPCSFHPQKNLQVKTYVVVV